jgi:hypothetical protein
MRRSERPNVLTGVLNRCRQRLRQWPLPRLFAAISLAAACAAHASTPPPPCPWNERFVSAKVKPLPASAFAGIDRSLTIAQIVAKLGPAKRDVGSGLYVLQWPVADGRWFSVSVADACSKPAAAGFLRHVKPPRPRPGMPPVR